MKPLIEACVETAHEARAAQDAGADRIELCSALSEGGVTPSLGAVRRARALLSIPLVVLVRPRGGDFFHPPKERAVLVEDLRILREEGVDGVAIGGLTPDGELDAEFFRELVPAAESMEVICHRALDHTRDLEASFQKAFELGCRRVLSSGGLATAWKGREVLARLQAQVPEGCALVVGGSVRPDHVAELVATTGARELHLSAAALDPGAMRWRPSEPGIRSRPPEEEAARKLFSPAILGELLDALST